MSKGKSADFDLVVNPLTGVYSAENWAMHGEPMGSSAQIEISRLLIAWRDGEPEALNQLVPAVYAELRRVAHGAMRRQAGEHTLQTTALINEAFLKLAPAVDVPCRDRAHFLALCAQVMRRILVDSARARISAKRGGGAWRVQFDEDLHAGGLTRVDVMRLDDALIALARVDARKAKAIELRFFGGLSVDDVAEALGVSRETVLRDWRMARAWLKSELSRAGSDG
jgi:RNA polymerase sigma-70 factor, ECF subfamily